MERSMLFRSLMIGAGSLALACNSNIELGTNDGGDAAEAHAGKGSETAADGGSAPTSALEYTYCSYTSDAGAPTCSAFAPWTPSAAETAQAQLNCMAVQGSTISLCPSAGLVGCCSIPLCPPQAPGVLGSCEFTGQDQPGENVLCSYEEDAGTAHVNDLKCLAAGGAWTTTVPQ